MNMVILTVVGILMAILLFGVKTGIGCGFSNRSLKSILLLASSYLILSIVLGSLIGYVDQSNLDVITSMGMSLHVLVALLLIGAGIYTQKQWNCGCDVSHRTFLVISLPCPVCLTALFISCMLLASYIDRSGTLIGLLVGVVFFISVVSTSLLCKKLGKTPETLGNIMMILGIYYLMGAIIVPAYIKTKQMNIPQYTAPPMDILPFVVFAVFIAGGFVLNNIRSN
ncbi:DUF2162 domain-containing protein [Methanococcoides alaskense]|uniref:Transporter n=1 Tax=Methanococcoides alaskense TaxID=325778 RepID=A0AA90U0X9_9EURY|nr:DUF2162 domain-containing protein [Methanococcoides alaskense]MDA0524163.1 DUF2162 domain-containing protein [Methanococcoides alaskense]MDR6223846.1 putative transporter [Methanococcoides alaskense]